MTALLTAIDQADIAAVAQALAQAPEPARAVSLQARTAAAAGEAARAATSRPAAGQ